MTSRGDRRELNHDALIQRERSLRLAKFPPVSCPLTVARASPDWFCGRRNSDAHYPGRVVVCPRREAFRRTAVAHLRSSTITAEMGGRRGCNPQRVCVM
jgi:hypothetical protein